jgi:hypothetical protein
MDLLTNTVVPSWVMAIVVAVLTVSMLIGLPLAGAAGRRHGRRLAHPESFPALAAKAKDSALFLAALLPSILVWLAVMGVSFIGLTGFASTVLKWDHWTNILVPLSLDGISVSFGAWAFVAVKRGRHPGRAYKIVLAAAAMSALLNFVHGRNTWSVWAGAYLAFLSFAGMAMFHELLDQFMASYDDEAALKSRYPRFGQRWLFAPISTFNARRAWIVNPPRDDLRPTVRNALSHLEDTREARRQRRLGGAFLVQEEQQAKLVEVLARNEVKAAKRGDPVNWHPLTEPSLLDTDSTGPLRSPFRDSYLHEPLTGLDEQNSHPHLVPAEAAHPSADEPEPYADPETLAGPLPQRSRRSASSPPADIAAASLTPNPSLSSAPSSPPPTLFSPSRSSNLPPPPPALFSPSLSSNRPSPSSLAPQSRSRESVPDPAPTPMSDDIPPQAPSSPTEPSPSSSREFSASQAALSTSPSSLPAVPSSSPVLPSPSLSPSSSSSSSSSREFSSPPPSFFSPSRSSNVPSSPDSRSSAPAETSPVTGSVPALASPSPSLDELSRSSAGASAAAGASVASPARPGSPSSEEPSADEAAPLDESTPPGHSPQTGSPRSLSDAASSLDTPALTESSASSTSPGSPVLAEPDPAPARKRLSILNGDLVAEIAAAFGPFAASPEPSSRRRAARDSEPAETPEAPGSRRRAARDSEPADTPETPASRRRSARDPEPAETPDAPGSRRRAARDPEPETPPPASRRRGAQTADPTETVDPAEVPTARRRAARPSSEVDTADGPIDPAEAPPARRRASGDADTAEAVEPVDTAPARRRAARQTAEVDAEAAETAEPAEAAPGRRRIARQTAEVDADAGLIEPAEAAPSRRRATRDAEPAETVDPAEVVPARRRGARQAAEAGTAEADAGVDAAGAEAAEAAPSRKRGSRQAEAKAGVASELDAAGLAAGEALASKAEPAHIVPVQREPEPEPEAAQAFPVFPDLSLVMSVPSLTDPAAPLPGGNSRAPLQPRVSDIMDSYVGRADDVESPEFIDAVLRLLGGPANRDEVIGHVAAWVDEVRLGLRSRPDGPGMPKAKLEIGATGAKNAYPFEILTMRPVTIGGSVVRCPSCGTDATLMFSGLHARRPVDASCGCGQRWPIVGLGSTRVWDVLAAELLAGHAGRVQPSSVLNGR